MDSFDPNDASRFANFNIYTKVYKTVDGHPITVDILYSKNPHAASSSKPRPVLLRFHGGGLVSGSSLFPPFFAPWILQLAVRHSAVIVCPNYRLIPESSVRDALDDVEDAWTWIHESLPYILQWELGIAVDTSRIMVTGDSAGGYLSIQLGLSHPDEIRAVTASYLSIDVGRAHFLEPAKKPLLGLPMFPQETFAEHVADLRKGETSGAGKVIVSADPKFERATLMRAMAQHGQLGQFYPTDQRDLHPLLRLEDGARFPRGGVVVWHGKDDTNVPVEGSMKLKDSLERLDSGMKFQLVVRVSMGLIILQVSTRTGFGVR